MSFCNIVDLLYKALPLARFRARLIRAHIEGCPRCQARLLSRDEARGLLVAPARLGGAADLWNRISAQAVPSLPAREMPAARGAVLWRWAAVTSMTAALALAGFWLLRQVDRPGLDGVRIAAGQRFELDYVNVGGAPAQTFVYQPQGTDTVFVWASKTP